MFSRVDQSFANLSISEYSHAQYQQQYQHGNRKHSNMNAQNAMDQFSFKQNYNSLYKPYIQKEFNSCGSADNTLSLRDNLIHLQKDQIIQILLQQIKSNKYVPSPQNKPKQKSQNRNPLANNINYKPNSFEQTFSQNKNPFSSQLSSQQLYKQKYDQLVKDFEQYINNTNQAQSHLFKAIQDLKKQNQYLNKQLTQQYRNLNTLNNSKNTKSQHQLHPSQQNLSKSNKKLTRTPSQQKSFSIQKVKQIQKTALISKLQQTVQNYLNINNQLQNKIQKLQRTVNQCSFQKKELEKDLEELSKENDQLIGENQKLNDENTNFKSIIDQLKEYIEERRKAKERLESSYQDRKDKLQDSFNINKNDSKNIFASERSINFGNNSEICNYVNTKSPVFTHTNTKTHNPQSIPPSPTSQQDLINVYTFRMLQASNKQLKQTNSKLQQLIQKKSDKIRYLLQQIQQISEQKVKIKQELIALKCKSKKYQINGIVDSMNVVQSKISQQSSGTTINNSKLDQQKRYLQNSTATHPDSLQGIKMINSSIYSLKNSQSNSNSKALLISNSNPAQLSYHQNNNMNEQNMRELIQANIKINQTNFKQRKNQKAREQIKQQNEQQKISELEQILNLKRREIYNENCKKNGIIKQDVSNSSAVSSGVGSIKRKNDKQSNSNALKQRNTNKQNTHSYLKTFAKQKYTNINSQNTIKNKQYQQSSTFAYTGHSQNQPINPQFHIPRSLFNSNKKFDSKTNTNNYSNTINDINSSISTKNNELNQPKFNSINNNYIYDKSAYLIKSPENVNSSSCSTLKGMKKQNKQQAQYKQSKQYKQHKQNSYDYVSIKQQL